MSAKLPYLPRDIVQKILSQSNIDVKVAFGIKPNDIKKTFKDEYETLNTFWQRRIKETYHGINLTLMFCHINPSKSYVHVVLHYVPRENTYVFDFINMNGSHTTTLYQQD